MLNNVPMIVTSLSECLLMTNGWYLQTKHSLNIILAIPNTVKHHFHLWIPWRRPASGARCGEQQQLAGRGTCSFHQINGLKLEIISRIRLDVVLIKPFISPYFHLAPGTFLQNQLCGWKWNSLCRFNVVCFEPSKGVVLKQLLFPAKEQNKEEFTLQIYIDYHHTIAKMLGG